MIMKIFFLLTTLAMAYIPSADTILSRVVDGNGKSSYFVDQDVNIFLEGKAYLIKEKWLISPDGSLKISAMGAGELKGKFSRQYSYSPTQKIGQSAQGQSVDRIPLDFMDRLHTVRDVQALKTYLVANKVTTSEIYQSKNFSRTSGNFVYKPESFIRLGRTAGSVAYVFAQSSNLAESLLPSLWVEQDFFRILKFRAASGAEYEAERYSVFAGGFVFPRERYLRWEGKEVHITLNEIRSVQASRVTQHFQNTQEVSSPEILANATYQPLQEFYTRFR